MSVDPNMYVLSLGGHVCEGYVESEPAPLPDVQITLHPQSPSVAKLFEAFKDEHWVPFSGYGGEDCQARVMVAARTYDNMVVFTVARRSSK